MNYLKDFIILIISILGSIASVATIWMIDPQEQGKWALVILGFLISICLFHDWRYSKKVYEMRDYVNVYSEMNAVYAQLRGDDDKTMADVTNRLKSFCEAISTVFTKLHGTRIGVCIKLIVDEGKEACLMTVVRDAYSSSHGRKSGTAERIKHTLANNTDFSFLYENIANNEGGQSYYYNDDIASDPNYCNTSLQGYKFSKFKYGWATRLYRRTHWPLKYRSTIVVPIIPLNSNLQTTGNLRGFLCLDSPQTKGFYAPIDSELLRGAADELCQVIDKLATFSKTE